jgi:NADH-quinone oxidoreductase subunit N
MLLEKSGGRGLEFDDYRGLGTTYPLLALSMAVFMLSFTGVPPTLGFAGKFYLFRAVLEGGYVGLAIVGVLTSLVSAYYYLRVVVTMYMQEGNPSVHNDNGLRITAAVTALGTVLLFIFSQPLFDWASRALLQIF